jgi:signal transduction histidine kinase
MMSNLEEAMLKFNAALKMAEDGGFFEGQAQIYNGIAGVQLSLGNYEEALSNGLKSLKIIQKMGNKLLEAWSLNSLGMGYFEWGEHQRALQYFQKSLKLFEKLSVSGDREVNVGMARAMTGIGGIHQNMGNREKALDYYQKSLEIFKEHDNQIGVSRALNDLGTVHQQLGNFEQSQKYHLESLNIREAIGNKQAQCTSLINLGQLYIEKNEIDTALEVLHRALHLAMEIKAKPRMYQANQALSEAYAKQGKFKESLAYYKMFHDTKEEVAGDEAKAKLKNLQIGFAVEKTEKEAEITRLKNVELKQKNSQLKKLLKELKETQSRLIQSEKTAALGNLVAGVVHEINSPVAVINSAIDVVNRSIKTMSNSLEAATSIQQVMENRIFQRAMTALENNSNASLQASQRVSKLVQSLKSFARIDEAAFQLADLNEGIETALTLLEHDIHPHIKIVKKLKDIPKISCYPAELNQVFMNLLSNASMAIKGKGTITIETLAKNGSVHIKISDTGSGIPRSQLNKLFEPSFSKSGSRVKAGMGLFTALNIVQKHQGDIKVQSQQGKGSTFSISLPV